MSAKAVSPQLAAAPSPIFHAGTANGLIDSSAVSCKSAPVARSVAARGKRKKHEDSLFGSLCTVIADNQIGLSVNLLLLLSLTHIFFPRARRRTGKFFHMSYYNADSDLYGCGTDDLQFVTLWIVIFTGMRVLVMEYLLDPIARSFGIRSRKGLVRFKEQAWLVMYCTCSWSLGMYLMYHSEFWFNLNGLWKGWPFRELTGLHKWYYLLQWAFYMQQILVVNIEEKRKDYAQMFTHHIFTSALIFFSYGYYHTRVGTIILCIMDIVDIILPTAKLLKYTGYTTLCDIAFGAFAVTWTVTRQIFFPLVIWSIYAHTPTAMAPGCYLRDGTMVPASATARYDALGGNHVWTNIIKAYTDREAPICWNPTIRYSFLGLLLALLFIICLWFVTICKVVWKVLSGQGAEDARSDDEGEGECDDEDVDLDLDVDGDVKVEESGGGALIGGIRSSHDYAGSPVEEEVGVEGLSFAGRKGGGSPVVRGFATANSKRMPARSAARTSAISIPGHGDHKELLGRIGCDKPT